MGLTASPVRNIDPKNVGNNKINEEMLELCLNLNSNYTK